jgi:glycosyltransferase involved in cell wall biosynthesis/GT2 family glycosyltransferase
MLAARKADVIVAIDRNTPEALACLETVLRFSGLLLNRLIVIADGSLRADLRLAVENLASVEPRLAILDLANPMGPVAACNQGLGQREGDAIILRASSLVTQGWLSELSAVAHAEERVACVSPLSAPVRSNPAPATKRATLAETHVETPFEADYSGLPRSTTTPGPDGCCTYFRAEILDAVGLLDTSFASVDAALDDWVVRAQSLGFFVKRANHAFVHRSGSSGPRQGEPVQDEPEGSRLAGCHPQLQSQVAMFKKTIDDRLASHAAEFQRTGRMRVAYDIRHLPPENVGTRIYAINLAKALCSLPEIDLTLLVSTPAQARGLEGRVVMEDQWRDDVALIHKPAQVFDRLALTTLYGSSAHVVITYQDLIAYRSPAVFRSDREYEAYRATSGLSLQAAQGIIAYSESSAREIASEFGIPRHEIVVIPLGVDAGRFAGREPRDADLGDRLKLPARYFFSLATDLPHKNTACLLEAYALLRSRWSGGEPPGLVLAGYSLRARGRSNDGTASEPPSDGLTFLGPVSDVQLRILYQRALALVYPSLYEGFGLPPLEAMAAGTPVVAMAFSSVPDVGGDAVLYAEGLSADALAQAMERLAQSDALRADLRDRGLKRAAEFRWENTARAAFDVYRRAVLEPSERSLQARRMLREAILHWSELSLSDLSIPCEDLGDRLESSQSIGVRNAWRALNAALNARMRRELRRFRPARARKSA